MISKVAILAMLAAVAMAQYAHPGYGYGYGHHDYYQPQPYDYGYDVKDDYGNQQYRKETGDGKGGVKGSYGYTDAHGIHRQVDYVADHHGFRANVKTNEPGTANQNPAAVGVHSAAPQYVPQYAPHYGGAPHYAASYPHGAAAYPQGPKYGYY